MNMKVKKVLIGLLSMLMVLAMMPNITFAEGEVAKVDDTSYQTMEEALAQWGPGKTLTLLSNVTTTTAKEIIINPSESDWVLNLGDYTWSTNGCDAIQMKASVENAITGANGLVINADKGGIDAGANYCINYIPDSENKWDYAGGAKIELNGGTYTSTSSVVYYMGKATYNKTPIGPFISFGGNSSGVVSTPVTVNGKLSLWRSRVWFVSGTFNGNIDTWANNCNQNVFVYTGVKLKSLIRDRAGKTIEYGSNYLLRDEGYWVTEATEPTDYKLAINAGNVRGGFFDNHDGDGSVMRYFGESITFGNNKGNPADVGYDYDKVYLKDLSEAFNYNIMLNKFYVKANTSVTNEAQTLKSTNGTIIDATASGSKYYGDFVVGVAPSFMGEAYLNTWIPMDGSFIYSSVFTPYTGYDAKITASVLSPAGAGYSIKYYSVKGLTSGNAMIGDKYYFNLASAVYALNGDTSGKTIKIVADSNDEMSMIANENATYTIDLNGKSFSPKFSSGLTGMKHKVTIVDTSAEYTGTVASADADAFMNGYPYFEYVLKAGTYNFDPSNFTYDSKQFDLVAENYEARDNKNGTWTVVEKGVAKIDEAHYDTLQDAVDNAIDGSNVTLIKNTTETVAVNKSITITLNGKTADNVAAGDHRIMNTAEGVITFSIPKAIIEGEKYATIELAVADYPDGFTKGLFAINPVVGVKEGYHVVPSKDQELPYLVEQKPAEEPEQQTVIVEQKTEVKIEEKIESDEEKAVAREALSGTEVTGVADSLSKEGKTDLIKAAQDTKPTELTDEVLENAKQIDISITVEAVVTNAETKTAATEEKQILEFEVTPYAVVTAISEEGDAVSSEIVKVENDYLSKNVKQPITVVLGTPFEPAQVLHYRENGEIEAYTAGTEVSYENRTYVYAAPTENKASSGTVTLQILDFSEIKLLATAIPEYTVSFDSNGGSGSMEAKKVVAEGVYILPANGFSSPEGKQFYCWTIGGKEYDADDEIIVTEDVTVKAKWENAPIETYKVSFDANGGSGSMEDKEVVKGRKLTLPKNTFNAPKGKAFDGWLIGDKVYSEGDKVDISGDITVKAQWVSVYTITFDANGGTGTMGSVTVKTGTTVKIPDNSFKAPDGKKFKCWSIDGQAYNAGSEIKVTKDIAVKAEWTANVVTADFTSFWMYLLIAGFAIAAIGFGILKLEKKIKR